MKPIKYQFEVLDNSWMTPTVFSLRFRVSQETQNQDSIPLNFVAGQFVSVTIPGAGPKGRDLRRAYSIASPPQSDHLELCVKLVEDGPGTQYLVKLKTGDRFEGIAPFGDFVYRTTSQRQVCFIATGTGVAPFRAMLLSPEFKKSPPSSVSCLFGVGMEEELLYQDELNKLPSLRWVPCLSRSDETWDGFSGRVTDFLRSDQAKIDWPQTDFYLCGNGDMIKEVRSILEENQVDKSSIHMEKYY